MATSRRLVRKILKGKARRRLRLKSKRQRTDREDSSALKNDRERSFPTDNVGTWFVLSVYCFISKALFRGPRETGPKKKKITKRHNCHNVLIPLLSSIFLSGCLFLSPRQLTLRFHFFLPYDTLFLFLFLSIYLCRGSKYWTRQLHTIFLYRFLKSAL